MKTTLILLTIIFAAAWAGCSDNLNLTDPLEGHNSYVQNQPNHTADNGEPVLLWSLDELKVWTISEEIVENKAVYNSAPPVPPLVPTKEYMVAFDVSTNAEKTASGYVPLVRVYKDDRTEYEGSDFNSRAETTVHKEIRFKGGSYSQIKFYIALFQVDGSGNGSESIAENSVYLTLKNIKIFKAK